MIIKSMARKEPTFEQLYDYITREGDYDEQYCFTHNFILKDRDSILEEYHRNASLLARRKNGNYLYHEILSITRADGISEQEQKDKLLEIVRHYAQSRAKNCLVFGGLHIEKDNNLHFHLIISANELNQTRRYRLSKRQFSDVKIGLETHVLEHIPELEQEQLISAKAATTKTNHKEQELKRRTGKPSQKEVFKNKLETILKQSSHEADFLKRLKKANIERYIRGKTIGFLDTNTQRKHRLKTLGLVDQYEALFTQSQRDFGTAREWLKGDFSERKKKAQKRKWREQDRKDQKVKDRAEQTTSENLSEEFNEWILGDFSAREARARTQKSKQRLDEYRKKRLAEKTKNKIAQETSNRKSQLKKQRSESQAQQDSTSNKSQSKPKRR